MTAGNSALQRASELSAHADRLELLVREKRREAQNYRAAAASESGLAGVLAPLRDRGWVVFEDRRWPGSRRANVDFILVGPPGVIVLDAKHWTEVRIDSGMLYRGDSPEDAQIDKLHRLLDALHDGLQHTGLTPSSLLTALVFTDHEFVTQIGGAWMLGERAALAWLLRQQTRLSPPDVTRVADALDELCPPMSYPGPAPIQDTVITSAVLPGLEDLAQAMIDAELAGPIEDWMVFLHPDQNRLIRSTWNGPARLRGPAGSGKTTVALHRAAYLALRSPDPVLFVTFVRTPPQVMRSLATRINRRAASAIEFSGLHQKAREILDRADVRVRVDAATADAAFGDAWRSSGVRDVLARIEPNPRYWKEEIDYVIKGRGLIRFDDYLELTRIGRSTRLSKADRRPVWELFDAYQAALGRRGIIDFNDLLVEANRVIDAEPSIVRYSAVVVDEVQDLTMVGLRLLDALSGDGPNRLLMVGDGRQSVYPGGFTLAEAGISITGRAAVLDRNYRNTIQILSAAHAVVADADFIDIEEVAAAEPPPEAVREGMAPDIVRASTAEVDAALVDRIRALQRDHFIRLADMAVLTRTRAEAVRLSVLLDRHAIPVLRLETYDGTPAQAIKVGTIKRAKGLEFKAVFLPGADLDGPRRRDGETDEAFADRRSLARRELYVGMTRARDWLWMGCIVP